jgi:hypothetical protein
VTTHPPIFLDNERLRALEQVAAEERVSLDEILRRAVDSYLRQRAANSRPWAERLDEVLACFREGAPADMTPEEIEAEITANLEEYRAERVSGGGG